MTSSRDRTIFGGLLAAAMAVSIFSAPAIGILSRFIIDDLEISRAQLGWVVTAITMAAALMSPMAGRISDVAGGRTALLLLCVASAVGLVAIGVAPTYLLLLVAAVIAGFAQAMGNPATNASIVLHLPVGDRGTITGVKQSGVQAGIFVGGLLLPAGALAMGWRPTVVVAAAVPLLLLVAMVRLIPGDPAVDAVATAGRDGSVPAAAWWLAGYGLFMGFGQGATMTYLPLYVQEDVALSVTTAGAVAALVGFTAIPMRIAWGRRSERSRHFGTSLATISAGAVVAVIVLWAASPDASWFLWPGAVLLGATAGSWNAVGMVAIMAAARTGGAGKASGVVLAGFSLGLAIGPPVFGYSVDDQEGYGLALAMVMAMFSIAFLVALAWRLIGARSERPASEQAPIESSA